MSEGFGWLGTLIGALLLFAAAGCEDIAVWDDGRHWAEPEIVGGAVHAYKFTDLAVSRDGTAMAVWTQGDSGAREDVYASRYASNGWSARWLLEERSGPALFPRVAMDDEGRAIVVWHQKEGGRLDIWSSRYRPDVGWVGPELLEDDDTNDARRPQVALNAEGTAVVVWYQSDGNREHIWARRFAPTEGWGGAGPISELDANGDARWPQVAIDSSGNALAVWQQCYANCESDDPNEQRWDVWTNRYETNAGWRRALLLTPGNLGNAIRPQVAMNAAGNAMAVWQASDADTGRFDVWAARYAATSGWTAGASIEVNDVGDATRPQVTMDPDGQATVVWQFDGTDGEIRASRSARSGQWTEAEAIGPRETVQATRPRIAADGQGRAVVVWIQSDQAQPSVWSNRLDPSRGWGAAEAMESYHVDRIWEPQVAMRSDGEGLAIWTQRLRATDQLWSRWLRWDEPGAE